MGKNNSLILNAIDGKIIPEEQTYQASLRQAMYDGITQDDVKQVVQSIVKGAKAGDVTSQKMLFDHVIGGKGKPTTVIVNNHFEKSDVETVAKLRRSTG